MKFTMFVTSDAMQVNLEPETEHETQFLAMLRQARGEVTLHHGTQIADCRAGYMRDFGELHRALCIRIAKAPAAPPPAIVPEASA